MKEESLPSGRLKRCFRIRPSVKSSECRPSAPSGRAGARRSYFIVRQTRVGGARGPFEVVTMTDAATAQTEALPTGLPQHVEAYPRRIICLTEETTETLYLL